MPPELHQPRLFRVQFQRELRETGSRRFDMKPFRVNPMLESDQKSSSPGELHPRALREPCGSLSAYTAPIAQPSGLRPKRQWANNPG